MRLRLVTDAASTPPVTVLLVSLIACWDTRQVVDRREEFVRQINSGVEPNFNAKVMKERKERNVFVPAIFCSLLYS